MIEDATLAMMITITNGEKVILEVSALTIQLLFIIVIKMRSDMKRLLFSIFITLALGIKVSAQNPPDATYRCKLPGTYDYVTIDYFNEGKGQSYIVFSNQSNMTITRMHVKVEVTEEWIEERPWKNQYTGETTTRHYPEKVTRCLCDDTFYEIPNNKSEIRYKSLRGPVKGGPEKEGHTYTYKVTVIDDPICKPIE